MIKMTRIIRYFSTAAAVAAILAVGGSRVASATIISFIDNSLADAAVVDPVHDMASTWTLTLPKLDPTTIPLVRGEGFAKLNSVKIIYQTSIDVSSLFVVNIGVLGIDHFDVSVDASALTSEGDTLSEVIAFASGDDLLAGEPRELSPAIINNTDYGFSQGLGDLGLYGNMFFPTNMKNYLGSGFFDISGTTLFSGDGGPDAFPQPFIDALGTQSISVEVDYDFSYAPEPATMGLMGSALIGIVVCAKRFTAS